MQTATASVKAETRKNKPGTSDLMAELNIQEYNGLAYRGTIASQEARKAKAAPKSPNNVTYTEKQTFPWVFCFLMFFVGEAWLKIPIVQKLV